MTNKTISRTLPLIITAMGIWGTSSQALADRGDISASLKVGQVLASDFEIGTSTIKPDGGNAFGLAVGYEFASNWTAEFMFLSGTGEDNEEGFFPVDIDYTSIGLFGVYRSSFQTGSPYFLGRVGFSQSEIELSTAGTRGDADASGLSFGAGAGYQYSEQLGIEAEYYYDADEVAYLLISAKFDIDI